MSDQRKHTVKAEILRTEAEASYQRMNRRGKAAIDASRRALAFAHQREIDREVAVTIIEGFMPFGFD